MGANRASIHALNGSGLTLNPEILESKFQQAEQTLEQMIADHYIPGVDAIVGRLAFTGEPATPSPTESFLAEAETTWGSLLSGTAPEGLSPAQEEVRNIYLAYSQIFSRYGDNMRKLALHLVQPLNTTNFVQIAQQIKWENEENITNSVHKFFFEANGDPSIIFTTNSILLKNWCITAVNYILQECQKALAEDKNLTPEAVAEKIDVGRLQNPFQYDFLPMLNNNATNTLTGVNTKYLTPNSHTDVAIYAPKEGHTLKIADFTKNSPHLGTSAKKLMDVSILYLTSSNYYKANTVNPTAIISLMDYWRAQGYQVDPQNDSPEEAVKVENRIKKLKNGLRDDLKALESITWDGYTGTGKNRTQQSHYNFISGWRFMRGNKLKINFDIDLATALVHSYQMQYPTALLRHDNRSSNSYPIGRKIMLHHSMDHNAAVGTANTISVESLLKEAPAIPTYDSLVAANRRDWKPNIKSALEKALDDNIRVGLLSSWTYRQPGHKNTTTYTSEDASSLPWEEYSQLVIDFELADEPDQTERRERRNEEKAKQKSKSDQTKKKRGRPKKTTNP